jgi:hypothetical protein
MREIPSEVYIGFRQIVDGDELKIGELKIEKS